MASEVSTISGDQSLEELRRELAAAREQQAATSEILRVISSSPMDSQRVFAEIAASAARLCDAYDAAIFRADGNILRLVGHHGPIPNTADGTPLKRGIVTAHAILDRRTIQVADLQTETDAYPESSDFARRDGHRTLLAVPLIRAAIAIGTITIRRTEARLFSHEQIALLETFASQAVIAIENTRLFEAEQARTREVTERTRELTEALEQQTATADVLKVISRSALDLQRVLDALVESAARLCNANDAAIFQVFGDGLRLVAHYGQIPTTSAVGQFTLPLVRGVITARAVIDRRTSHVADILTEADEYPETHKNALQNGWRTSLCVPLVHAGEAIGVIHIRRAEVRPFTERQIELVNTFADQAVIAIENTRLFEEVQARTRDLSERTRELTETLQYQTATSEVLSVISRSPSNLQPVLDVIVETAARLCQADIADFRLLRDGLYHITATTENEPTRVRTLRDNPIALGRNSVVGRVALEQRTVHVPDIHADPEYNYAPGPTFPGMRAILGVPLLRDNEVIGVIVLFNSIVKPFSQKQIALITTFANQAVIAIENTRLFEAEQARTREVEVKSRELAQSLEFQTATSEVLSVIGRSQTDVHQVFTAIMDCAVRLCRADLGGICRAENGQIIPVAFNPSTPEIWKVLHESYPRPIDTSSLLGRALVEGKTIHIPDIPADAGGVPQGVGFRSQLSVPILADGQPIGVLALMRRQPGPYTPAQIALVNTFADQAVIAIENTRLFEAEQASKRELTEALEQQTATAEVLKVISRSALDLQRVLNALVESAARLCDAYDAVILQVFDDGLRLVAHHGQIPFSGGQHTIPLVRGFITGRVVIERRTIHVADILAEADEYPGGRRLALQSGFRTSLAVPLIHAGEAIGVIFIRRVEVRPFTERQVELVNTFADQAVIAIENTRLFEEVQARTRELAKTVEDLEIASQHKNQFVANMSHELRTPLAAILGYAELIQEGFYEPQGPKSLDALTRIRSNGKHLLGLINTVLDIAKIESGQFTLNMTEYAIESVVETVRAATESLAQNKKLALKTEVAKSLPVGLGDEQRLTQVLLNLVGNAIKFTDTGEVHVTAKAVNGHFNVSVTDTGPGIPEEHQTRIFEQFHQVDSSNTKTKGGTGLGLAIAKEIVEMHGGRIWVESTVGKGSTFQLEIPARVQVARSA